MPSATTDTTISPTATNARLSQVAALCHRESADGLEVLLITSSNGRWILPKGWPMDDRSDAKAAQQEAWEEAGVKAGALETTPVGTYVGKKAFNNGTQALCKTTVYAIDVAKTVNAFPESAKRDRKWVPLDKAADAVDDAELAQFLETLQPEL